MSRRIIPNFTMFGFEAEAQTNCPKGGDGGHGGHTEIKIRIKNPEEYGLSIETNFSPDGENGFCLEIIAKGDWEADSLTELFESVGMKLREDMNENKKPN